MFLLIFIGKYEELAPNKGYGSMRESFSNYPYPGQDKIIHYLRNGKVDMVSLAVPIDAFTGEKIPGDKLGMNDGKYTWWNTLAYYVEKYNLRLPEEFERYILQ